MNHIAPKGRAKPKAGSNAPPPPAPLTPEQIAAYLDYAMAALLDRRAEVIAALDASAKAHPTIDDDDTLDLVAENVRMANKLVSASEDKRKTEKAPFLTGGRAVDGWFTAFGIPIIEARKPVQAAMTDYGTRVEAERRAIAIEAQRIADAAAAQAAAAAADLLARATPPVERELNQTFDAAAAAAREAEKAAALANARPADLTRSTGLYGATTSMRVTWKWRVTDAALIPRAYLEVSPTAILAAAKERDASGKPTAVIPGVEFYSERSMGVR
jgi:hypothetical protein